MITATPRPRRNWFARWAGTIAFVGLGVAVSFGFWQAGQLRESDARVERTASLTFCKGANERTMVMRDTLLEALKDPDPRVYAFIQDPVLRQGVIDQGKTSRAAQRQRIQERLSLRDCAAEFPAPPGE